MTGTSKGRVNLTTADGDERLLVGALLSGDLTASSVEELVVSDEVSGGAVTVGRHKSIAINVFGGRLKSSLTLLKIDVNVDIDVDVDNQDDEGP